MNTHAKAVYIYTMFIQIFKGAASCIFGIYTLTTGKYIPVVNCETTTLPKFTMPNYGELRISLLSLCIWSVWVLLVHVNYEAYCMLYIIEPMATSVYTSELINSKFPRLQICGVYKCNTHGFIYYILEMQQYIDILRIVSF